MTPELKLTSDTLALVVIDTQEKLAGAMPAADRERCVRKIGMLIEAARLFDFPVLVTEQYPKGLGPTVPALRERLDAFEAPPPVVEKLEFDALGNVACTDALDHLVTHHGDGAIRSVLVVGMEAHVCVYQTVRGLIGSGFHVQVPWDATCSRDPGDQDVARGLWTRAGAIVTSTETVLFDLLGSAEHEHFEAISKLVRNA
ncbi:MAG TPA: isochorismatase family protein [Sandaracinaceae bacterium LLY-WYZ-13_1]|nr:isochorismatase family protein [Sandaracinaceae bacterium LLY-WYZ-13_1]